MGHKIFAYGTLKDYKLPNTHYALGKLYEVGSPWGLPAMKLCDCRDSKVNGQLLEVTDQQLAAIDIYEGHPHLYKRSKAYIQKIDGTPEDATVAWVYIYQPDIGDGREISKWPV